jgi:hypothetical protein
VSAAPVVIETVDRRVLGAFSCVDSITGSTITPAVPCTVPQGWTVKPNRSGIYVIFDGPGLDALTDQFIPSGAWPSPTSFEVSLVDASQRYLPRRASVQAPLAVPTIPPVPATPTGVFAPQQVNLYPSAAAPVGPNWATIYASVTNAATGQGLAWAMLQVVETSGNTVLATGMSGPNGEALLAVIGLTLQTNSSSSGPVTVSTTAATITAYFDPTTLTQPPGWIPDPDAILNQISSSTLKTSSQAVQLSSGQQQSLSFAITV